jgi:hypothetical protein
VYSSLTRSSLQGWVTKVLDTDGAQLDTIAEPVLPAAPWYLFIAPGGTNDRGLNAKVPIPYSPQQAWALSPLGYVVTGFTSRYAVDLRIPPQLTALNGTAVRKWREGDRVVSIRKEYLPISVPAEERDSIRWKMDQFIEHRSHYGDWNGHDIPRVKPPYKDIQIAHDGRIWVKLHTASERIAPSAGTVFDDLFGANQWREKQQLYDIFETDGQYVGQVPVPLRTELLWMSGDTVWASVLDDDDVPVARRFRVKWQ